MGSQASVPGCFFCANDLCLLAFSFWRPAELLLCICCTATASAHLLHRSVFCASAASQRLLCICCIAASSAERQALPLRLPLCSIPPAAPPAGNIFPMALRRSAPGQQYLPDGSPQQRPRPATNLIWRRRSPVWLAIWRTWAGFANSQHRDAAYAASNNICAHFPLLPQRVAAQTDANFSAHLRRLPTPPPYLRQMRLSPGWGRRCWMANAAAGCPWRSSCKSPRARILVLGTSGAHWPARWPRFELTERVAKS